MSYRSINNSAAVLGILIFSVLTVSISVLLLKIVISVAKKFAEMQPKKEAPAKKEKGGKEGGKQQPQQQQEKKEKKKEEKQAAPAEEEMDECEAALASEPKAKDPFVHLPKRYLIHLHFRNRYFLRVSLRTNHYAFIILSLVLLSWMSSRGNTPTRTP